VINLALQGHLLKRAVHLLGFAEVAKQLGVPADPLRAWLDGRAAMPERTFSELVDILIKIDGSDASR